MIHKIKYKIPKAGIVIIGISLFGSFFLSCSAVFTGSIYGSVHDQVAFEEQSGDSGIGDVLVYLYTDGALQEAAFYAYENDRTLPDLLSGDGKESGYFLSTVTAPDGTFSFNGFIWEELFSQYGKSGDRKEVFLLFYHPDYGVTKNAQPLYIVSDVSNQLAPVRIESALNTARIKGVLYRWAGGETSEFDREPLSGGTVKVFVPTYWEYANGNMVNIEYPEDPTYILQTDAAGEYSREIRYPMLPGKSDNTGSVRILLQYEKEGFNSSELWDSDLSLVEDLNRDGEVNEAVLAMDLTADRLSLCPEIELKQSDFDDSFSGRVYDVSEGVFVSGRTVCLEFTNPESGLIKTYSTVSETRSLNNNTVEEGHFTFNNLTWNDLGYSGNQSTVNVSITVEGESVQTDSSSYSLDSGRADYLEVWID